MSINLPKRRQNMVTHNKACKCVPPTSWLCRTRAAHASLYPNVMCPRRLSAKWTMVPQHNIKRVRFEYEKVACLLIRFSGWFYCCFRGRMHFHVYMGSNHFAVRRAGSIANLLVSAHIVFRFNFECGWSEAVSSWHWSNKKHEEWSLVIERIWILKEKLWNKSHLNAWWLKSWTIGFLERL